MTRRTPLSALFFSALIGCQSSQPSEIPLLQAEADPRSITKVYSELEPVVDGINGYAWESWQASLPYAQGNLFSSPFSQAAAMSMVYAGAEGETEAQLAAALGVPEGGEQAWHEHLGALIVDLSGAHSRPYTLYTANRLWGQQDYPWEEPFLTVTEQDYQAPLEETDFVAHAEEARLEINDWVAEKTRERIPELFESGDIGSDTRLVLANAIYFKADWSLPFDEAETRDRQFTLAGGDTVSVPMMQLDDDFLYGRFDALRVLELPYESDEVSMVFLLPDSHDGLAALQEQLTDEQVSSWIDQLTDGDVDVRIPSFEMDAEFPMEDVLIDLGVEDAWLGGVADFSGMLDPDVEALWLARVVHKAFVRVDEQGTEAAAATGAVMVGESAPAEPREFHAERGFLFFIRDRLTGTILFQGRMEDPSLAPLQG